MPRYSNDHDLFPGTVPPDGPTDFVDADGRLIDLFTVLVDTDTGEVLSQLFPEPGVLLCEEHRTADGRECWMPALAVSRHRPPLRPVPWTGSTMTAGTRLVTVSEYRESHSHWVCPELFRPTAEAVARHISARHPAEEVSDEPA